MTRGIEESDDFDFAKGDRVEVTVRENGNYGKVKGKFEADVKQFREGVGGSSDSVDLDPPWDDLTGVTLSPMEAEFEVLNSREVSA